MTDEDAARAIWGDLKAIGEFAEASAGDVEALLDQRGADPGQAESDD